MSKLNLRLASVGLSSLLFSLPVSALGAELDQAILVKEFQTGFVTPENAQTVTCEIFADRTVVTRVAGKMKAVETRQTTIFGYQETLAGARKGKLNVTAGAVDIPTVRYYGNLLVQDSEGKVSMMRITLFEENGIEGTTTFNPAFEAKLLKKFLDSHCP